MRFNQAGWIAVEAAFDPREIVDRGPRCGDLRTFVASNR
jgi:hypothetical protein